MCQRLSARVFEQTVWSGLKTEAGGLMVPLKTVDWVLPAFWDGVECLFDDGFFLSKGDGLLWLLCGNTGVNHLNHENTENQGSIHQVCFSLSLSLSLSPSPLPLFL